MSHHHHGHDEEPIDLNADKTPRNKVIWVIWNIMFAIFYPVLAAFSLLMMILMFISSTLSRIIIWLASKFRRS